MAKVSIIIPHFNRSLLLKETIDSVQQQTYQNWEIIVVDDGSTAAEYEAVQLLRSHNIHVLQRTEGVKGPSICRNIGVSVATGDLLIFLDSDDLLASYCLEQRVGEMQLNPSVNMGIFKMTQFNHHPGDSNDVYNKDVPSNTYIYHFLSGQNPWNVTCPIWKKAFFLEVGGFNESLLFMEDPEIHIRALNHPAAVVKTFYEAPADAWYRVHHMDATKKDFYYYSIFYRLQFYKIITEKYPQAFIQNNKWAIRKGIFDMIKTFLFHRVNSFPTLYHQTLHWMRSSGLFGFFLIQKIKYLLLIGNIEASWIKALRIKGICYNLLPKN